MRSHADRRRGTAGIRCFVAVDLASHVCGEIQAVTEVLRRVGMAVGADVRWVAAGNLHVTLKFLGAIPEARVDLVRIALRRVGEQGVPFTIGARGLGVFPTPRRPRVVWVGLGGPALGMLAQQVDETMATLGFPPESRAFTPHVTIGRVRGCRGWGGVLEGMASYAEHQFGDSQIEEIVLYRSELRPQGPLYTALERFPLESA